MENFDLISYVQPTDGWFVVIGIKGKKGVRQHIGATRAEADTAIERFTSQGRDAYFAVAKFKSNANRTNANAGSLKAFWLDIDCGADKAVVNEKTGVPAGYATQSLGLQALKSFCLTAGLPKPTIVNSGRGLHVYWVLDEAITPAQWQPVADRLRAVCVAQALYVDPAVFETARVLRVPGTLNYKDTPPKPVSVITVAPTLSLAEFKEVLGGQGMEPLPTKPVRELTALGKSLLGNIDTTFSKIMLRSAKKHGCQQLLDCYVNRDSLAEPRWFNALSIAKFCVDKTAAIHKMSAGHPDYNPHDVEHKIRGIKGPHSCAEFAKANPGGCDGCPHKGKITSPIVLGKTLAKAEEPPVEEELYDEEIDLSVSTSTGKHIYKMPPPPPPFFRGKNGGIYLDSGEEEAEPVLVYEHDLYVVKLMHDPIKGYVAVLRAHLPQDGVIEFVMPTTTVTEGRELRRELARSGVIASDARYKQITTYIILSIRELQIAYKAELMRLQFGWADKDSKFIVGDREITKDGIYHSPPSSTTSTMSGHFNTCGELDLWKEVFALYGRPGLEIQAFAALSGFGAPLLKFTGQKGAVINLIHSGAGTGKTTALRMANSIFGHPEYLLGNPNDTKVGRTIKLGILNNIVNTIDEVTNMEAKEVSEALYEFSQGRGKDKAKSDANQLRENNTTWRTITVTSSNASLVEKLGVLKSSPDGELMRLLEFKVGYTDVGVISTEEGKAMFDHQLMLNFGLAGEVFAQWVIGNLEEVVQTVLRIQKKIDTELRLTQRERNWSAVMAANITGGLIAKRLGLIDWDMKRIHNIVALSIAEMRDTVTAPVSDASAVVGDYIYRHNRNMLVVDNGVDKRSNMQKFPILEPFGALLMRYEPDTKLLFIKSKEFKDDCVKNQVNYRDTVKALTASGMLIEVANKRLSKGSKIISTGVHSLVLDGSNPDFIDMEPIIVTAGGPLADAGGES